MDKHDYRDTVEQAKDTEQHVSEHKKRRDSETADEALAATSSMGMFGMEEQVSKLIELELAQQYLYALNKDLKED